MLLLSLLACGGANADTLVGDLRVMAIVPSSPEVAPGEDADVSLVTLDPSGDGGTAWLWGCVGFGDGASCTPAVEVGDLSGPLTASVTVPSELAAFAGPEPAPLVVLWALACAPGAEPDDGWTDDTALLADPDALMSSLPLHGSSLADWPWMVSTREERHANPTVDVVSSADGDGVGYLVTAAGDLGGARAYGYATSGGFTATSTDVSDGEGTLTWLPGDDTADDGDAEVVIVVQDGLGGVAVWNGRP